MARVTAHGLEHELDGAGEDGLAEPDEVDVAVAGVLGEGAVEEGPAGIGCADGGVPVLMLGDQLTARPFKKVHRESYAQAINERDFG